jgi:phosphate-selective porin OprO and OprP
MSNMRFSEFNFTPRARPKAEVQMPKKNSTLTIALSLGVFASTMARAEIAFDTIFNDAVSFEGLFQADANYFHNDLSRSDGAPLNAAVRTANTFVDDTGLRRAELVFLGKSTNHDWAIGYDAKAERWLDVFYRYKLSGFSNFRVGQFKQPNSLEELTSTKNNDFVAKSLVASGFALGRRLGLSYTTGAAPWTVTAALFTRELTNNLQKASGYALRGTYAPLQTFSQAQAARVLHFGISLAGYDPAKSTARLSVRPEADLANLRLIDSLNLTDVSQARQLGLEAAYLAGPVKLVAEYARGDFSRSAHADYGANAYSVSGVYNLSGAGYSYAGGIYKLSPNEGVSDVWQLAARYSYLDADDGPVRGGVERNVTLGVNWYWRANFKWMANISTVRSTRALDTVRLENAPRIIELRAQMML